MTISKLPEIPVFRLDWHQIKNMRASRNLHVSPSQAEWVMKITEQYCWRAIAQGVGNRVWRSDPFLVDFNVTYSFQILRPGEPAPGSGIVFGPFSKG